MELRPKRVSRAQLVQPLTSEICLSSTSPLTLHTVEQLIALVSCPHPGGHSSAFTVPPS